MTRTDVTFDSGGGSCAAWLYAPSGQSSDGARPVIVMAHGLGGVKEMRLDAFAERFTEAGYVCLVFDYRHFGASSGEPRPRHRCAARGLALGGLPCAQPRGRRPCPARRVGHLVRW